MVDVHITDNDKYFIKNYMKNEYVNDLIYEKDNKHYLKKFKDCSNELTDEEILEEISILRALFYLDENNRIPFKKKPNIRIDGKTKESRSAIYVEGLSIEGGCSALDEKLRIIITPKPKFKVKNLEDRNIRYIMILFSEINSTNLLIMLRKIKEALDDYDGNKYYKYVNITKNEWIDIKTTLNQSKSKSSAHNTKKEKYGKIEKKILSDNAILNYFRRIIKYYIIEDRGFSEIEFLD
ncbi:hypothetical protein [Methanobrevibacter sp.]|uniref:hypothetical protein n=1 Tax=Methanobrevibacter sp. TaxID=66852 RepID=UPI002609D977|nr:hypothetical protein [uncultured Methanobrevibacter sp.]